MTELQKNVSNPRLYRYDEAEDIDAKKFRHGKAEKDLEKRLDKLNRQTGQDFGINAILNDIQSLKELLYIKGIATKHTWRDIWLMVADRSVKGLEDKRAELDNELAARRTAKKLYIPGQEH